MADPPINHFKFAGVVSASNLDISLRKPLISPVAVWWMNSLAGIVRDISRYVVFRGVPRFVRIPRIDQGEERVGVEALKARLRSADGLRRSVILLAQSRLWDELTVERIITSPRLCVWIAEEVLFGTHRLRLHVIEVIKTSFVVETAILVERRIH